MKKGLIIGGIAFGAILLILIAIPFLFRDTLLEKTKSTLNRNLNADINFSDFSLSLIRNFPKASLSLGDVIVTGKGAFQGDTLFYSKAMRTRFGLFDLFSPENITIQDLVFEEPYLQLLVDNENRTNWDIFPEEAAPTGKPGEAADESTFGMELKKITIDKGNIRYYDVITPMELRFNDINLGLNGKLFGSDTRMEAKGTAEQFGIVYDSVAYLENVKVGLTSTFDINFDNWLFKFTESEVLLNNLPVEVKGSFAMPEEQMDFDLEFSSAGSEMEKFLAFVPSAYQSYLKDLKASGNAQLTGSFKGIYLDETYPALQLLLKVSDGVFRYAGLPEEINRVKGELAINKPQGGFELTTIEVAGAHAEIRNTPVDFSLKLANLMEDMQFGGRLKGKLNFDILKDAIPMDSLKLSGLADVNIGVSGSMSAIEKSEYGSLQTDGTILLDNFSFVNYQMTMPVTVSTGKMDFSPQAVTLEHMQMKIGQSDMSIAGQVRDYYPWFFADGMLAGNIAMTSSYLNINELMAIQKEEGDNGTGKAKKQGSGGSETTAPGSKGTAGDDEAAVEAFEVPERVNITIQTDIAKALYDKMNLTNISGRANINDGRLNLDGLTMRVMDGDLKLAGSYSNTKETVPAVNMTIDMAGLDIPTAFQSLKLVRNYLPIAAQSKGKFTTSLQLRGNLDEKMQLIPSSLNGTGLLNTMNVQVINSPIFNKIKSVLNEDKLRDLRIDDFVASFTIANGNLILKPFKTKVSGQEATFSGRLSVDNLINMDIAFNIQREALSKNIEQTLAIIPGQKNIQVIPVGVSLKGPVGNPDVSIDLSEAKSLVKKEFREATKEDIQKTINKVGEGLKKLIR